MFKLSKKGAVIILVLLLIIGIVASVYLARKQPNIFSKVYKPAISLSGQVNNKQEYTIIPSTASTITLADSPTVPQNAYFVQITLKDKSGIVANQSDLVYTWTASNTDVVTVKPSAYCAPMVSEPCPLSQARLTGGAVGSATVKVVVVKNGKTLAETSFKVVVAKSTSSPAPLPDVSTTSSCQPRPACLDSKPKCLVPEPTEGWCPSPSPL